MLISVFTVNFNPKSKSQTIVTSNYMYTNLYAYRKSTLKCTGEMRSSDVVLAVWLTYLHKQTLYAYWYVSSTAGPTNATTAIYTCCSAALFDEYFPISQNVGSVPFPCSGQKTL